MMVIDRGIMQGVQRGQRLTIFRRSKSDRPVVTIGDGIIVSVRADRRPSGSNGRPTP